MSSCLKKKTSPYRDYNIEETLRYSLVSEPPTLDWNKSTDTTSSLVIQNLMEGLAEYDFSGPFIKARPALALRWTSSPDNKTWSFFLRDDISWTDGAPLTAKHFVDSWERLLRPETGSEYAYFLFPIKNARAYNQGKIKDFKKVGVKAPRPGKLVVELEEGLFYFPYLLTHTSTFPIRKELINQEDSLWTEPENIVTLGAYRLHRWDHDKALILVENKSYYGTEPSIKKVILYVTPDEATVMNLYSSGRLDIASPLISRELPLLRKRKDYRRSAILSLYYYGFNVQSPILKDPRMRKAFIHAVDREEIVQLLNRGDRPLKSWIPKGIFAHKKSIGLDFNPEKSRGLLREMGFNQPTDVPPIQMFYNSSSDHKTVAENVQSQLKRHLGLRIELNSQEWKSYLQRLKAKNIEVFRLGWLADYPDPDNFMNLMTGFSDNNHSQWKNKRYD